MVLAGMAHDNARQGIGTLAGKNPAGVEHRLRRSAGGKALTHVCVKQLTARRVGFTCTGISWKSRYSPRLALSPSSLRDGFTMTMITYPFLLGMP
jgi:hypothetical protein